MTEVLKKEIEIAGRNLSLEVGRLAEQADMAVLAQYGETCVLATVVTDEPQPEKGYFPLHVDYLEKLYAGGVIKGSRWVKREGRPSDEAVLAGRMIDRSIRPLFPAGYRNETQVVITVLSVDGKNDPVLVGAMATFAALSFSSAPWQGPIALTNIGLEDEQFVINPTEEQKEASPLDLVAAGNGKKTVMIEAEADQVSEDRIAEAVAAAQEVNARLVDFISQMREEVGVEKVSFQAIEDSQLKKDIDERVHDKLTEIIAEQAADVDTFLAYKEDIASEYSGEEQQAVKLIMEKLFKKMIRKNLLAGNRPDGRDPDEVRPLNVETGLLPRTHGSALFSRGKTQALTITTLGPLSRGQTIETAAGEEEKRYIHHYFMPPFTVGETGWIRGPGRREKGHGALAEKALRPVIPSEDDFPYAMRLVSEVMSSNGSTSMASVCGSSLSLMDAGVAIESPVAGIAIGAVTGEDENDYQLLTDIAGIEDFNGEMDFKVAGTKQGITAIQLDVKNRGLTPAMIEETLEQAKEARRGILTTMNEVISQARGKISPYAPHLALVKVDPEKIGNIIGSGGRTIREICDETGCEINVDDEGRVTIMGEEEAAITRAKKWVKGLVTEAKVGKVYEGKVKRVESYGAFVEILPGKEGLVHVSRMEEGFVKDPHNKVSVGDKVKVKVYEIDERDRINLTMVLDEKKGAQSSGGSSGSKKKKPSRSSKKNKTKNKNVDRFSHFRERSTKKNK